MATSPWYREGTAKFTEGSTTVTGTGTRWVDFVRAGDGIQGPDGKVYQVTNVASNTSLSITPAYGSETTYWTIPVQGYVKRLADAASQLIRDFEGGAVEAIDAADRAKQSAIDAETQKNGATSEANRAEAEADRAESEADRSELEADRAQQAADDAVAVVTGGDASIEPEAGKIPLAGASGTIKQAWVNNLEFELDALRVAKNKILYGDGPYPVMDFQFQGAKLLDPRIEFTRASLDWDEDGNEYGIDVPVLTDKGLWVNGSRTNLFYQSRDLTQLPWRALGSIRKLPGLKSPIGTDVFSNDRDEGTSNYLYQPVTVEEGVDYTLSCLVQFKSGDEEYRLFMATAAFDGGGSSVFTLGEDGGLLATSNGKYKELGGGWFLIWRTGKGKENVTGNHIQFHTYPNDPLVDKYMSAPQFEVGAGPTAFISTEDSQVTVATGTLKSIRTSKVRTVTWEVEMIRSLSSNNVVYFLSWGENETGPIPRNGVFLWSQRDNQVQARVYVEGSHRSVNLTVHWEDVRKIAFSIREQSVGVSVNGRYAELATDSDMIDHALHANVCPSTNSQSRLRWIKAVSLYEKAMTEQQLRDLTS